MLTLAIPQSDPTVERKRSAERSDSVKIAEREALANAVLDRDGFVEVGDFHAHRGSARTSPPARSAASGSIRTMVGSTKLPGRSMHVAAVDHRSTLVAGSRESSHHVLDRCWVTSGPIRVPLSSGSPIGTCL